jgi:hypothetical protein
LDRFRRVMVATLACYFAGCAVSAETTRGQFDQIKPGMTHQQVVGSLGEPARTDLVNDAPSEDVYACDEQGQIMVIKESQLALGVEDLFFPLAIVDFFKLYHLNKRARICEVHYDHDRVLSTSQPGGNGIVVTK